MKKTIIALLIGLASVIYAEEPPAYLKDGKIVVTLKDGKQYEYSTNEWMVVRRGAKKLVPAEVAASSPAQRHFAEPEHNKNRVRLMGGVGPVGLQADQLGSTLRVQSKYGAVGGLGYDRQLNNKFSLGAAGYTNGTFSLGVGLDF